MTKHRLTDEKIKQLMADGYTVADIANIFETNRGQIYKRLEWMRDPAGYLAKRKKYDREYYERHSEEKKIKRCSG